MWRKGKKLAQVARLWALGQLYEPDQDDPDEVIDDAATALGLFIVPSDESDPPEDRCYLWPCNVPVYNLWLRLQTQWRVGGMGQKTGLDYDAVATYMYEVAHIKRRRPWHEAWGGIHAMETAALRAWDEQRS